MYNIFNKEDTKVQIQLKINSKAKRLKQLPVTNPGVGKIKKLRKNPRGDYIYCNILYCNNKCQRVVKTFDGNLIFYYI